MTLPTRTRRSHQARRHTRDSSHPRLGLRGEVDRDQLHFRLHSARDGGAVEGRTGPGPLQAGRGGGGETGGGTKMHPSVGTRRGQPPGKNRRCPTEEMPDQPNKQQVNPTNAGAKRKDLTLSIWVCGTHHCSSPHSNSNSKDPVHMVAGENISWQILCKNPVAEHSLCTWCLKLEPFSCKLSSEVCWTSVPGGTLFPQRRRRRGMKAAVGARKPMQPLVCCAVLLRGRHVAFLGCGAIRNRHDATTQRWCTVWAGRVH